MKIFTFLFKRLIDLIGSVLKQSNSSLEYLFTVSLKEQVNDYVENRHFQGYLHIEKGIALLKSLTPRENFLIVDVGGGSGETVAIFNKELLLKQIHSFEPISSSFEKIKQRFQGNPEIITHNTALGNFKGKASINIAKRITSSSIFELKPEGTQCIAGKAPFLKIFL